MSSIRMTGYNMKNIINTAFIMRGQNPERLAPHEHMNI